MEVLAVSLRLLVRAQIRRFAIRIAVSRHQPTSLFQFPFGVPASLCAESRPHYAFVKSLSILTDQPLNYRLPPTQRYERAIKPDSFLLRLTHIQHRALL